MAKRRLDYPTGNGDGMSFISNRWVFTGPQGYRVQFTGTGDEPGDWSVFSYDAAETRIVGTFGMGLSEEAAHELAARLAKMPVHPPVTESATSE